MAQEMQSTRNLPGAVFKDCGHIAAGLLSGEAVLQRECFPPRLLSNTAQHRSPESDCTASRLYAPHDM